VLKTATFIDFLWINFVLARRILQNREIAYLLSIGIFMVADDMPSDGILLRILPCSLLNFATDTSNQDYMGILNFSEPVPGLGGAGVGIAASRNKSRNFGEDILIKTYIGRIYR
jgi:hypothetical protein